MKAILTPKELKSLTAGTRVEILKKLNKRPYLQTELAEELELKAPTIKQHVDALIRAGMVNRKEEGRKWKYIELTDTAKNLLNPERQNIMIVLSLMGAAIAGGFVYRLTTMGQAAKETVLSDGSLRMMEAAPVETAVEQTANTGIWAIYAAAILILAGALAWLLYKRWKRLKTLGKRLTKTKRK